MNIAPNYVNSIELKFALGTDLSNVVRRIFLFIFPRRKIRVCVISVTEEALLKSAK